MRNALHVVFPGIAVLVLACAPTGPADGPHVAQPADVDQQFVATMPHSDPVSQGVPNGYQRYKEGGAHVIYVGSGNGTLGGESRRAHELGEGGGGGE